MFLQEKATSLVLTEGTTTSWSEPHATALAPTVLFCHPFETDLIPQPLSTAINFNLAPSQMSHCTCLNLGYNVAAS